MTRCSMCGTTSLRCTGRMPLPGGGWVCRDAVVRGIIEGPFRDSPDRDRPGWSRSHVVRCPAPRCGERAYTVPAELGFPWRRCHRCGNVFNPEALAAA